MTLPDTEWDAPVNDVEADELEEQAAAAGDELEAAASAQPKLYFATLPDFIDQFLIRTYRREISHQASWCTEWWKHPEAVCVLDALWRAWEALRLDPATGMSVWWRDHCYPHMAKLSDPNGTFKNCTRAGHYAQGPLETLPWGAPPPELYGQMG